jgi:hypothetical protein
MFFGLNVADRDGDQVIQQIGAHRFSAVCSDNTGNTAKARKLIHNKYKHILNVQDICHPLNLAIQAICALPEFKEASMTSSSRLKARRLAMPHR